jgi:hypothetical protein
LRGFSWYGHLEPLWNNLDQPERQVLDDPGPVPDGGNYIAIDGDPRFASTLSQTIFGLTPLQTYTVSFDQGAAQFLSFTTSTTEQWLVSFDTPGDCNPAVLTNSTNCASQLSTLISNPAESSTGWGP